MHALSTSIVLATANTLRNRDMTGLLERWGLLPKLRWDVLAERIKQV